MPTVEVEFSNIEIVGSNTFIEGEIVGADPWGDDSDATYTKDTRSFRSGVAPADWIVATIPAIPDAATVTAADLSFRASATNIDGTGPELKLHLSVTDTDLNTLATFDGDDPLTDAFLVTGSPADYAAGLVSGGDITAGIRAGCYLVQRRLRNPADTDPADYIGYVYKLTLTLTYTTGAKKTRMWPRKDHPARMGMSNTRQTGNRPSGVY